MEKEAKKDLTNEVKRFMSLAGIKEGNKKFITNESFQESIKEEKSEDGDFIIFEFEQTDIELGEDDELYKIKMDKKDD